MRLQTKAERIGPKGLTVRLSSKCRAHPEPGLLSHPVIATSSTSGASHQHRVKRLLCHLESTSSHSELHVVPAEKQVRKTHS